MSRPNALTKPDLHALPVMRDRMTFLYVERCKISREDGALCVRDIRGTTCVPAASLSVLMLGPGTNISHRAVELAGDMGVTLIWVGERGVRYYAHGRPLTQSSRLADAQARLVSNTHSRLAVAREMYQMRSPNEDVSHLTMQQLRGRESARIRSVYRRMSKQTGVPWSRREYDPSDFNGATAINQALSAAHACLYGICHSVIVSLGCSPALGFVHVGHERSFVYDIADLYKAKITIPIAFEVAAAFTSDDHGELSMSDDVGSATRRRTRDALASGRVVEQVVRDLHHLLLDDVDDIPTVSTLHLWDDKEGTVAAGRSYGTDNAENETTDDDREQLW